MRILCNQSFVFGVAMFPACLRKETAVVGLVLFHVHFSVFFQMLEAVLFMSERSWLVWSSCMLLLLLDAVLLGFVWN